MPFFNFGKHTNNKSVDIFDPEAAKKIRTILKEADLDGDNRLTKDELKNAFSKIGSTFPAIRTKLALYAADKNGDGVISGDLETEKLIHYVYDTYAKTFSGKN